LLLLLLLLLPQLLHETNTHPKSIKMAGAHQACPSCGAAIPGETKTCGSCGKVSWMFADYNILMIDLPCLNSLRFDSEMISGVWGLCARGCDK
ncbi:hypothetical protein [truncated ORF], partial [Aspergillus niger]|uniref:Uncharacterized protein n=2 Tax=Aspergillus niger TaxID=5061 RepID=A0AAJ8DZ86_ASPNG